MHSAKYPCDRRTLDATLRMAGPALAALLVLGVGIATGVPREFASGWFGSVHDGSQVGSLELGADGLVAPDCIANPQAPAMRLWISQHPKSRRGRLDHRRQLPRIGPADGSGAGADSVRDARALGATDTLKAGTD
jgi:hypothetical protein